MADRKELTALAAAIASRQCNLLVGSGFTSGIGGKTWPRLVEDLLKRHPYKSPLMAAPKPDYLRIMGDLCKNFGKETIYREVQTAVGSVKLDETRLSLLGLPWFATFTTNYDTALEDGLRDGQRIGVRTVTKPYEFQLSGLSSEVQCVKLMGTCNAKPGAEDEMVLSNSDYQRALELRGTIYQQLAEHLANLNFLYLGYSFDDKLLTDLIDKISGMAGSVKGRQWALFLEPPSEHDAYYLESNGIKILVGTLDEFLPALVAEVKRLDVKDHSRTRIQLGPDIAICENLKLMGVLDLYKVLTFEDCNQDRDPLEFFQGNYDSLKPFAQGWHFKRQEEEEIVSLCASFVDSRKNLHIDVRGFPGNGRTFLTAAVVTRLIREHRFVAIRIRPNYMRSVPSADEIEALWNEVRRATAALGVDAPRAVALWADRELSREELIQFEKSARYCEQKQVPLVLLTESDESGLPAEEDFGVERRQFLLRDILTEEERGHIKDYLARTIKTHKLPEQSPDEMQKVLAEENCFLPVIYRTLHPSKQSIDDIVSEVFHSLGPPELQTLVAIVAFGSSFARPTPLVSAQKLVAHMVSSEISQYKVVEYCHSAGKRFLKMRQTDTRTELEVYHQVVADRILRLMEQKFPDQMLSAIAQTALVGTRSEANYVSDIFIAFGVRPLMDGKPRFGADQLESELRLLSNRQPSRVLLHHLARLVEFRRPGDPETLVLLKEALAPPVALFALDERVENVYTTLANTLWRRNRAQISKEGLESPATKEILRILEQAEANAPNVHAYDVHLRVVKEALQKAPPAARLSMFLVAEELVDKALDLPHLSTIEIGRINELRADIAALVDAAMAETLATRMLKEQFDGSGFAALARLAKINEKPTGEIARLVDLGLSGKHYPDMALALKLELLMDAAQPNYKKALEYAQELYTTDEPRVRGQDARNAAIAMFVNGKFGPAAHFFKAASTKARFLEYKQATPHWMESGRRRTFTGTIDQLFERGGWITCRELPNYLGTIYFNPEKQEYLPLLRKGLAVKYEMGFVARGPIAGDVRPAAVK